MNSGEIEALGETAKNEYYINEATAAQVPFLWIATFIGVIALVFVFVNLPKIGDTAASNDYRGVLRNRNLVMGAFRIFFYIGAEVALGSYMVNYFLNLNLAETIKNTPIMTNIAEWVLNSGITTSSDMAIVGVFVTFYWTGAMIGRFIGSYLTKLINPAKVLVGFAIGAICMIVISSFSTGLVAKWTLTSGWFFNSIMFPTIFSLALDGLGNDKPRGSGILCTMIMGGAVIPPTFGFLTDSFGFGMVFLLVILCYAYIIFYGTRNQSKNVSII